ncbi:MAG: NRDE family protein [Lautropia sp.]|nr:NRDE family protein [Lautropia sp.]
MCLVALAWQHLPGMPLCLISNRDEFYARPTAGLAPWRLTTTPSALMADASAQRDHDADMTDVPPHEDDEDPNRLRTPRHEDNTHAASVRQHQIIAGRDLQSGGTWLGITPTGRWAVLTNVRDARDRRRFATSRGALVADFLTSDLSPLAYQQALAMRLDDYAGFNLIVGTLDSAVYLGNGGPESRSPDVLSAGVHVLCNGQKIDPWAKSEHIRQRFLDEFIPLAARSGQSAHANEGNETARKTDTKPPIAAVLPASAQHQHDEEQHADVRKHEHGHPRTATTQNKQAGKLETLAWHILEDRQRQPDDQLPDTGVSLEWERLLSSTFIQSESHGYGTRCSNLLMLSDDGAWHFAEKTQHGPEHGLIRRYSK